MKASEVNNLPKEGFVSKPFPPRVRARHKQSHWIPINEHLCCSSVPVYL